MAKRYFHWLLFLYGGTCEICVVIYSFRCRMCVCVCGAVIIMDDELHWWFNLRCNKCFWPVLSPCP